MLPVSEAYAEAIKLPNRVDRLTGKITLNDGTVINITDNIIMSNSVTLTEQLVSGNTMEIGTFLTNQLTIAVYDEEILSRSYANAEIVPYYGLKLPDGTWEDIPLGVFKADNNYTKRKGSRHMLTAFDCSVEFDRDISGHTATATVQAHITSACKEVGVTMSPSLNLSDFPNADVTVSASSKSIQTYRDLIEWCAALMGASAKIDRYGKFTLIVLDDKTEGTQYLYDVVISGDERFGTEFFDLRALTKYVSTTFDGQTYVHTRNNYLNDELGRNAVVFVPENPLLKDNENAEKIFINSLTSFTIALRSAEFSFVGNPAMECFDTVGVSGGQIDLGKTLAIFPTKLVWKYRGKHSVSCAFAELTDETTFNPAAEIALFAADAVDNSLPAPVKVRSQTEKRIDGVDGGEGGVGRFTNEAKNSEIFNEYHGFNTADGVFGHTAGVNNKNSGNSSSICGGTGNSILSGNSCTIAGGASNTLGSDGIPQSCFIGGGVNNKADGSYTGILSGVNNKASALESGILAGLGNTIDNGNSDAIAAGSMNKLANDFCGFIGAGQGNEISNGSYNFIGSGLDTKINGYSRVSANGWGLVADRDGQVLFGQFNAPTNGKGVFVIGNGTSNTNRSNLFVIYADGTVGT